jgi:predicted enzyme related to lactoylglutathione lyase
MSEQPSWKPGRVVWQDLTVGDAEGVRDFYKQVVGWESTGEDMGGYEDHVMLAQGGDEGVAGICHARGVNSATPPQWLIYISVANLGVSIDRCLALGGKVIDGPRKMGATPFCVIQDPAGAVCALIQTEG